MVQLGQRGVSDVLVIAFMFILLAMAAMFVFNFTALQLEAASDRQLELKSEHLHQTLKNSAVVPYAVPALEAAAQQLVLADPTVDNSYLTTWLENTLDYLLPQGYGAAIKLTYENEEWELIYPSGVEAGENFIQADNISYTPHGEEPVIVGVKTRMFEIA